MTDAPDPAPPPPPTPPERSAELQRAKALVRTLERDLDRADAADRRAALRAAVAPGYRWTGAHPLDGPRDADGALGSFWTPLHAALRHLQRRTDVLFAGVSQGAVWVASMGHHLGMFEAPFLDIPPTRKMAFLRSCEFHRVGGAGIEESLHFFDPIGLMIQAGMNPLPQPTGAEFLIPGPRGHDGIVTEPQDPRASARTLELILGVAYDLGAHPEVDMDREVLRRRWHDDMIWYGPSGIGSTMGIDGFKRQHQMPFRKSLYGAREFVGHQAEIAEGVYGGWIGWPSLRMVVEGGGYMGLPATRARIDMRVIDIYRREGEKLAENWVFIDTPHVLLQQDLDIFERMRWLLGR